MDKTNVFENHAPCTSCGACAVICPTHAISISLNSSGFFEPVLNEAQCNRCGLCARVCPKFLEVSSPPFMETLTEGQCFMAYSKSDEARKTSSSGGLGFELARAHIEQGYHACGVFYSKENERAEHFGADNVADYKKASGSKYLQSYTYPAFSQLWDGNRWIVFGTPCQIYGVKRIAQLRRQEDRFLFVELFCEGVPSYHLWRSYLHDLERKHGPRPVEKINFRDKTYGWHNITMSIQGNGLNYRKGLPDDFFYYFFSGLGMMNLACYECKFRWDVSCADIRLGDFWGPLCKKDDRGVSLAIANTEKGFWAIRQVQERCLLTPVEPEQARISQPHRFWKMPANRSALIRAFQDGKISPRLRLSHWMGIVRNRVGRILPPGVKSRVKTVLQGL